MTITIEVNALSTKITVENTATDIEESILANALIAGVRTKSNDGLVSIVAGGLTTDITYSATIVLKKWDTLTSAFVTISHISIQDFAQKLLDSVLTII